MSNQPISLKINRDKIDPKRLFKGERGTYLDAVLIPTPNNEHGNDFMIVQGVSKEEREAGVKGPIIGNAKFIGRKAEAPSRGVTGRASEETAKPEGDDIPF